MPIQWFPGHMHKARLQMQETIPRVDLVVEVLDARIPFSSENPMLAELRGEKPCLKVLHKADLADPALTRDWLDYLNDLPEVTAKATSTEDRASIGQLVGTIVGMLPDKKAGATITTMVAGIPNVGKSTIINTLAGRKIAKTGNEPAVTKHQQRIKIGEGVTMLDTPGVMWPNVENVASGYRLAAIGSIKETAREYDDVAFFIAGFMIQHYFEPIAARFGIDQRPENALELVEAIGRRRGCLGKGGLVDLERAAKIFITELRSGKLGPVSLETPEMMVRERQETAERIAEQQTSKAEQKRARKQAFQQRQARKDQSASQHRKRR